ncbi:hypothetical protein [Pseudarthrobacter sp. Y6]|uniref:hypothetical protein n=1 Tax=Pseudarthrobacter sp. Y6 TaxID=3418422 RepID=UPI00336876CE
MPALVFGNFEPVCGSAWFRGIGGPICTPALLMPTVFSLMLAVLGIALLIVGLAMKQGNE